MINPGERLPLSMQEGNVILTPVPQADGVVKNRPAIILREMPLYKDLLVCGVSTQLYQQAKGFDEIISPSDTDFTASGLKWHWFSMIVRQLTEHITLFG